MDRACGICGGRGGCVQGLVGKLERDHLEDVGVEERMTLK
jgi:hypothetical protein